LKNQKIFFLSDYALRFGAQYLMDYTRGTLTLRFFLRFLKNNFNIFF